jgi:hypothetical protein
VVVGCTCFFLYWAVVVVLTTDMTEALQQVPINGPMAKNGTRARSNTSPYDAAPCLAGGSWCHLAPARKCAMRGP